MTSRELRKPFKITDRERKLRKGITAATLDELIIISKQKLNYLDDRPVIVVLDEDGTEVDEEEYFQTLSDNTVFMILYEGDRWLPIGPSINVGHDAIDSSDTAPSIYQLLNQLNSDPGYMALLSGKELEVLAEMDPYDIMDKLESSNNTFKLSFLKTVQSSANTHLTEKNDIRDAINLLKIYHVSETSKDEPDQGSQSNQAKKRRKSSK